MRRLKVRWRNGLPARWCEELEHWVGVLLTVAAALLLFAALRAQLARADEFPRDVGAGTLLFQSAGGG